MNIAIIGVGLIGGSIGLAIKNVCKNITVTGIGRNINRLRIAKKLGAVDNITTDFKKGLKDADIIFVCIPVGLIVDTVKNLFPYCKNDAIVTDVGSAKEVIVTEIEKYFSDQERAGQTLKCNFVGGHPIAGSEKTSVKYASKDLYKNSVVVLTPTARTNRKSLNAVKALWQKLGAKVEIMTAGRHDRVVSYTSHLPHVVSFALVNAINHLRFAGSSFKDTTRIVSSDPEMWADIFCENRQNVLAAVTEFKSELNKIEKASSSRAALVKIFQKAKHKRERYVNNKG